MVKLNGERFRGLKRRMEGFAERKAMEQEQRELQKVLHEPAERQEQKVELERLEREAKELRAAARLQRLRGEVREARRMVKPQQVSGARRVFGGLARVSVYGQRMLGSGPTTTTPASRPKPINFLGSGQVPTISLWGPPQKKRRR